MRLSPRSRAAAALLAALGVGGAARSAAANGAFPDSMSVLVPAARPYEIVLATNFGLITSEDDGATWTWSCEQDAKGARDLYQYGPPDRLRLFARDAVGLVFTDDGGCSWGVAAGAGLAGSLVTDAFPDPVDPMRVLAIVAPMPYRLLESTDAGSTFGTLRYAAAPGVSISSVEIARSDARTVYLVALSSSPTFVTKLLRSPDSGTSWQEHDVTATVGPGNALIIAVDPADAMRVFLRVNADSGTRLVITEDGGGTFKAPLQLTGGTMTSFALLGSGTILVTGMIGVDAVLYRSNDRGATFEAVPNPPQLWGLAERGTVLYGAGRTGEAFAVGTSRDEGSTWTPLMRYEQVVAIDACVKTACQETCQSKVDQALWDQAICAATAPPRPDGSAQPPADAGAGGAGGAGGATEGRGGGGAAGDSSVSGAGGHSRTSGCSCETAAAPAFAPALLLGAVAAALVRFRSRKRRVGPQGPAADGALDDRGAQRVAPRAATSESRQSQIDRRAKRRFNQPCARFLNS